MTDPEFTPAEAERAIRRLLDDNDLPAPDEIQPREAGGITCLWYEEKVALILTEEESPEAEDP